MPAYSRPVSYAGGYTWMQRHNNIYDSTHIHYSPSSKYSLGYKFEYFRDDPSYAHSLQLNNLLFRKNAKNYQANIYLRSGLGLIHERTRLAPLMFSGLAMDWESRRLYAAYANRFLWGGDVFNMINNSWRVGFALYEGDYGDIHTWFMLQFDHNPINDKEFILTPLIRFFKGSYLLELGYSFSEDDSIFANFIWRL